MNQTVALRRARAQAALIKLERGAAGSFAAGTINMPKKEDVATGWQKERGGRIDQFISPVGPLDDDARIDEYIAESFPASDPPSWNSGVGDGGAEGTSGLASTEPAKEEES